MKQQMYTVYDKAVKAYLPPFYVRARGEALRSFSQAVNDVAHQFNKHSADYVLFFLGEFDDGSGIFSGVEPVRVVSALECLVDEGNIFPPEKELRSVDGRRPM